MDGLGLEGLILGSLGFGGPVKPILTDEAGYTAEDIH